jgi:hypothetical protein
MHKAILMHTDVDKGPKGLDVGNDAEEAHALFQVIDDLNPILKLKCFKLYERVTSGFKQLLHNVPERRKPNLLGDIVFDPDFISFGFAGDEVAMATRGCIFTIQASNNRAFPSRSPSFRGKSGIAKSEPPQTGGIPNPHTIGFPSSFALL